jgi:hypothetical protein
LSTEIRHLNFDVHKKKKETITSPARLQC